VHIFRPQEQTSLSDSVEFQDFKSRFKVPLWHQELSFKIQGPLKTFCKLITCIIGSRANDIVWRTKTTCQELQKADAPEQRKTTACKEEDGLLLTSDSFEDQDDREQRNYNYRAKNDNLEQRNKQPNNKVQRNDKTELQIEAPIKEMAIEEEKQLRKTDKSIVSAIGLRKRGLFLFIKKDWQLEWQQGLLLKSRSICDPSQERDNKDPNEFLFGQMRTLTSFWRPSQVPSGFS